MAGTNVVAAKRALIARLAALPGLSGIQVVYTWPGKDPEREIIYGGRARMEQNFATFAAANSRIQRDELAVVTLHVEVSRPDSDAEAGDERVAALARVVEEDLAANRTLGGTVTGLLVAMVMSAELTEPSFDDDGVACGMDFEIGFRSYLN